MTAAILDGQAPARRLSAVAGLRNSFTLTWRSVLKIRTNSEDLLGLSLQPIMFLLLFTYVFGGAIAHGSVTDYLQYVLPGILLGFRVTTNPIAAVAACLLVLAFAMAMCWVSALIGMLVKSPQGVQTFGFTAMFPIVFASGLLVPIQTMPGWLQAFAKANPMTLLAAAVRGLMRGGAVGVYAGESMLWALGILIVFAPLAVRAYRRRT
jgi:ABC-type polysaccharide/polyol phosphate export permease